MSPPDVRILDPEWWKSDPQDAFAWMREQPTPVHDEASGFWLAAKHGDVLAAESDATSFASRSPLGGAYRVELSPEEATMISQDDPVHLQQRRMINRRFTPRAVRSHTTHYESVIANLVDQAIVANTEQGSVEVVDALAAQLPCRVTAELIGFGADRWREVKDWSERQMRIDSRFVHPELDEDLAASINEWAIVMQELLPQRSAEPADDLFSDWIAGEMDPMVMVQETGLMIAGGAETTRTAIAHGLRTFVDHPDQWEFLAANPDAIPTAVEEIIRWVTPLNNMFRMATGDVELGGARLSAGDRVALVYPAANRDPQVFDNPQTFDVTRNPNPHLSFGHGTHFCLGSNVARQELRLLLEDMTRRLTNLRVVTEPDIEPNIFARAVRTFHMTFDLR